LHLIIFIKIRQWCLNDNRHQVFFKLFTSTSALMPISDFPDFPAFDAKILFELPSTYFPFIKIPTSGSTDKIKDNRG